MWIISKIMGRDNPGEYSGYVKEIRDRKAAELAENSRINKLKRYFQKNNLEDEVEEIASFEEPEIESSEPQPTIKSCIKTGMACTKEGILNRGKKIREYWESIGDAPVMQPTYIAIEHEVVHDEETREKVHETLSKSSKQKIPITSNSLSTKKARKAHLKRLQEAAYNKARAERKARDEAEVERKAIERGRYYGSTTVTERTVDRAKRVGKGAKRVAGVIADVANELGEISTGYGTKQGVKQVRKKINGLLIHTDSAKTKARTFSPARRTAEPVRKREMLAVYKCSLTSASSRKVSPASSKVKGSPSTSKFKGAPSSGSSRKGSLTSYKGNFSPSNKSKYSSLVNKTGFTGFGKQNKERPSFL